MSNGLILAIDQGTTNTKALAIDQEGRVVASASVPMHVGYPKPGWAEQSPLDIWKSVQNVIAQVVAATSPNMVALAISNQRETIVAWDASTGEPVAPAILWQCRRSAPICAELREAGHAVRIEQKTGLGLDPLFPAAKVSWMLRNIDAVRDAASAGRLRVGTVDSWLLWNLSAGGTYATDHSNASRTQLFNTETLRWDDELTAIFGLPSGLLPTVRPSDSRFADVVAGVTALEAGTPVHSMIGDSHAALYGHGVRTPGTVKATYGTGSSLMTLTHDRVMSRSGLSSTIAWSTSRGGVSYALEGNISVAGQAASFIGELLGIQSASEVASLAATVPDSNGVTFVPALVGLGAPHWAPDARGLIHGLALGTGPAHLARAAIDAIAQQVADVFETMESDLGSPLSQLSADGGPSRNDELMQFQADVLGRPVVRGELAEVSAMGAMMLAASGMNLSVGGQSQQQTFAPAYSDARRRDVRDLWTEAVQRTLWTKTSIQR